MGLEIKLISDTVCLTFRKSTFIQPKVNFCVLLIECKKFIRWQEFSERLRIWKNTSNSTKSSNNLKVACLVDVGDKCLCDLYKIFRNLIYERQEKELLNNYWITPQQARFRQFFGKIAYFYSYNNEIYVSKNILQAKHQKIFTDDEIQNLKKYIHIGRELNHIIKMKLLCIND